MQPPEIPREEKPKPPALGTPSQVPPVTDTNQQLEKAVNKNDLEGKEKKDRLKFRLEIAAAVLAIIGSLIAIFVYFLPGDTETPAPQSREDVATIILKALREGDQNTFEQHLSSEILNSSGDGENIDKLFINWQKDAKKPGKTAERLARIATFVRENDKWKLNER